jgi:DNA-binding IclR family transcriptional regulator
MAIHFVERAAEADLSGNPKVLLIELARRADESGVTDVVNYAALSKSVGVGVSTVHHGLNRLLDRGFVTRVERVAGVGSRYRVLNVPADGGR